jgi:aryl-alcohol dehydrogenase-like predicted oxidoreductase
MSSLREPQSSSLAFYPLSRALRSYEHGVNTFDTANVYSNGLSEVYLGRAIKALDLPREEIVVMTKVCGYLASVIL